MVGVVLILIALLVVLPVTFSLMGAAIAAIASWSLTANAEAEHEGSELLDLNT